MLPEGSLAGVHVFFPDPWHKTRHNKRRLIQPPLVARLAARLQTGGYLHCATDWQPYAEQMLEVLSAEPLLANTAEAYAPRPHYRPLTKFENRGLKLGHGVWDLVFVKALRPPADELPDASRLRERLPQQFEHACIRLPRCHRIAPDVHALARIEAVGHVGAQAHLPERIVEAVITVGVDDHLVRRRAGPARHRVPGASSRRSRARQHHQPRVRLGNPT